jgi:hypothetical protein
MIGFLVSSSSFCHRPAAVGSWAREGTVTIHAVASVAAAATTKVAIRAFKAVIPSLALRRFRFSFFTLRALGRVLLHNGRVELTVSSVWQAVPNIVQADRPD